MNSIDRRTASECPRRGLAGPRSAVAALAAGVLLVAGCGGEDGSDDASTAAAAEADYSRVVNVEVRPVDATSFTEEIFLTGTVQAKQEVAVAAEESGRIERILVEKGSPVRAGQPIIEIDDAILAAQVEQARARASLAQELWQRRKRLWEEERVGTEQAYLEARYGAEEAAANLEQLEQRLARTTIRAPFAGILDERMVEVGETVSPGTLVARVVELDTVKVTAGVPERFSPDVETGSSVTASFGVLPGETFRGEITYVGSTINRQNRTFPVEFTIGNPTGLIKPEMVANISVVRRTLDSAVVVPQEALVRTEEGFRAFVAEEEDGRVVARARTVDVGPSQRNRVVIDRGLSAGERLIVVGQQQVADGDRVRIVQSAGPGRSPVDAAPPETGDSMDTEGGER